MKKAILSIIFFAVMVCLFSQSAFGGAWTLPKNKLWGELYFKWHWAREGFDDDRTGDDKKNDGRSWGWVMEPKLEYGITDRINLLCALEYKEAAYKEYDRPADWGPFRRKNRGVSSLKLGGKVKFVEKPVVLSGQLKAFIYPGYGNYHGDDPAYRNQPAIGDGDDALEFRMLIGKRFKLPIDKDKLLKCYLGAESGYRFRNRDVCNDIPFLVEGGFWLYNWLLIKGEVDGYIALDGTGSIEKDYAVARIGPVFQFLAGDSITKQDRQFNLGIQYGHTFWGRNVSKDHEITFRIQFQI